MDDVKGFRLQWGKAFPPVVETAGEPELEVEVKDVTELLQSHDKTFNR